jgi:AraC-like DNA-binding protein
LDPLSQILALLRPQGFSWKQAEAAGDWALGFPAHSGVAFCLVAAGGCWLELPDQAARRLEAGDFVLLAAPPAWRLRNGAPPAVIEIETGARGRRNGVIGPPQAPDATRLIGGHFGFDPANSQLLTGVLPPRVEIRAGDPGAQRLRTVLDLIDDEARSDRPGRARVIERLLELMLVEAIRQDVRPLEPAHLGLIAGLADPQVATALRALHADVAADWTVARLAEVAGASRSAFAERFTRVVGQAPMTYLLNWRMALARDALRSGSGRLSEIAFACGYASASAFSTAFSRTVGCPPARYAAGTGATP